MGNIVLFLSPAIIFFGAIYLINKAVDFFNKKKDLTRLRLFVIAIIILAFVIYNYTWELWLDLVFSGSGIGW